MVKILKNNGVDDIVVVAGYKHEMFDEYKEKLEKVKDLTEQYLKIQRDEIPDAEKEWLEMQNAIKKNNDEIEKLELEDKLYKFKNSDKQSLSLFFPLISLLYKSKVIFISFFYLI